MPTTEQEKIDLILSASVHLVSVRAPRQARNGKKGSYEGVEGTFCRLDWEKHKNDPSSCEFLGRIVSSLSFVPNMCILRVIHVKDSAHVVTNFLHFIHC